jgi:hypothetical protein
MSEKTCSNCWNCRATLIMPRSNDEDLFDDISIAKISCAKGLFSIPIRASRTVGPVIESIDALAEDCRFYDAADSNPFAIELHAETVFGSAIFVEKVKVGDVLD